MKIAISEFGTFELSSKAVRLYHKKINKPIFPFTWTVFGKSATRVDWENVEEIESYCSSPRWNDENEFRADHVSRTDKIIIDVIEELGPIESSRFGSIKIIEIPDDVEYTIEEKYDGGSEIIREKHRSWS